jgi:hypothetical protein
MANKKISALTPKGSALSSTDLLEVSVFNGVGYDTKSLTGSNILSGSALTIGITPIASGTVGRVLFEGTGNVLQEDSNLFWDNTNKRLGLGATPSTSVRLDVRAQGALSTDIGFRVRNSANTSDLISIDGIGNIIFNSATSTSPCTWNSAGTLQMKLEVASNSGLLRIYNAGVLRHDIDGRGYASFKGVKINGVGLGNNYLNIGTVSNARVNVDISVDPILDIYNSTNSNIFRVDSRSNEGLLQCKTAGTPTTSIVDGFKLYSADIVAGNASPHFRTENGAVIKLYQETTAVTSATVVSGSGGNVKHDDTFDGYTVEKVVRALRNIGILA